MKIEFYATIKDGKMIDYNRSQFLSNLKKFEGKRVEVVIRNKSKRSVQQNRWYWACVTIISNHIGYSKEETHEILKFKFLKREKVNEETGEVFEFIKSTTNLTKMEFSELMEMMIEWSGTFFGIKLPLPEEQLKIELSK